MTLSRQATAWSDWLDRLAAPLAACLGFSLPLSTTGASAFALLFLSLWLLSGRWLDLTRQARANPVVAVAMLLLALLLVRMVGSTAPLGEAFDFVTKYRKLLFIAALTPFLADTKAQRYGINGFFAGMAVLLLVSGALSLGFLEPLRFRSMSAPSPISRITHSILMAFAIFWAAHRLVNHPIRRSWPWAVAIALGVFNIFFIVGGRTGQVIFVGLALLFLLQRLSLKRALAGGFMLVVILAGFFSLSSSFSGRIDEGVHDVEKYQHGNADTSVGLRYQFWVNTVHLWATAPLFGHGSGSFPLEYAAIVKSTGALPTVNPHNEYLLIAEQTGVIGLLLFLTLFAVMLWYSKTLGTPYRWLAQGLVLTMAVGCLLNSCLLDMAEGHFFAFFTAMFFAKLDLRHPAQI